MPRRSYSDSIGLRLSSRLVRTSNGCLEWTGARTVKGYGRIARGPRGTGYERTHRVAWELAHGPIPDGLCVLHRCDNPPCCDVDHLFLGTHEDNTQDMMSKGRGAGQLPSGAAHPDARLSDSDVATMREQYPALGNYAELGRRFGVSKQCARSVVLGLHRR